MNVLFFARMLIHNNGIVHICAHFVTACINILGEFAVGVNESGNIT